MLTLFQNDLLEKKEEQNRAMNMFRSIILGQKSPIQQRLEKYLSAISYQTSRKMPHNYYQQLCLLIKPLSHKETVRTFQYILLKVKSIKTLSQYPKLFTLINAFIVLTRYDFRVLSQIEKVNLYQQTNKLSTEEWFSGFAKVYSQYLSKLPFVIQNQISFQKKQSGEFQIPDESHVSSLFTLINLVSPLFPTLTTSMNVILRYQIPTYLLWKQLFERIGNQLLKVYEILCFIIKNIFGHYQSYKKHQIELFINSLADFQTICDRIEDYVMNKYLKGCKLAKKIAFRQEQIAQINYYLMKSNSGASIKSGKSKISLEKTRISSNIESKSSCCQGEQNFIGQNIFDMVLKTQSMISKKKGIKYEYANKKNVPHEVQ